MKVALNTHSKNMVRWGGLHPEAVVLSADLGSSCEIKEFKAAFPERYFSMGIAEQNMVSWAAGLAREGFLPYLHTFGVFLYRRVLDQLEMSVAYPNLPVTFVGFLPGIMTPGGVSHQAINDIATLRGIPNMTIFDMGDATDIEGVLDVAFAVNGPVFIRMLRKEVPRLFPSDEPFRFNKARVLSEGSDIALFSSSICTEEAMRATAALAKKGVSIQHLHVSTVKPFTDPAVAESLAKVKYGAVTIENHLAVGGLGTAVSEVVAAEGLGTRLVRVGLRDTYTHGASRMYLLKKYGLNAMTLIGAVEELTNERYGIEEADLADIRIDDYSTV